jgi:excisionase family DNA binding protein
MKNVTIERLLLRPEEAREILGLGRTKIYQLISSGQLPIVRIGGSVRIPMDELKEWIKQKRDHAVEKH